MAVYIVRPKVGAHRRPTVRERTTAWLSCQARYMGEVWAGTTADGGKDVALATWFDGEPNTKR